MKTKTILNTLIALLTLTLLVFQACKKDEEKVNQVPTCKITAPASGQEITKGETVTITVESTDSDGSISEVRFFIDGVSKDINNSLPYNYIWNTNDESIGIHTLKATGIDNSGGSTSDEITVTIIEAGTAPVADFTATPTSGTVPLTVNFSDQTTNSPTSWQWNFGDGSTNTEQNPTYTFNLAGTYTVTLIATNTYGADTETKTAYITVTEDGNTFTDPRDGQVYNIVTIGTQTWFAENMNYETENSWCNDDDPANCEIYGKLYTWDDAIIACPDGWHLSSDDEWKILEMHLGMSQIEADKTGLRGTDEGKKIKSTSGWHNDGNGTDEAGFMALPGGYRGSDGTYFGLGHNGMWWTATEQNSTFAWNHRLYYNLDKVGRESSRKDVGFIVRCLQD